MNRPPRRPNKAATTDKPSKKRSAAKPKGTGGVQQHGRRKSPKARKNGQNDDSAKGSAVATTSLPRYDGAWTLVLAAGRSTAAAVGHPWVFSGAISEALAPLGDDAPVPGMPCVVFNHRGELLGQGYYNAGAQLAARIALARSAEPGDDVALVPDAELVGQQLGAALRMRETLGVTANPAAAYRLVNSAGDGLPGLTIDRFADGAVVLASTAGAVRWLDAIERWLLRNGCTWIVARTGGDAHPNEGLEKGLLREAGDVPERVEVDHNGVMLALNPRDGAKSGLFLDQWANHLAVAKLCEGAYVVDAFCHTGGFGLLAAVGGARKVVCVDASARACQSAEEAAQAAGLQHVEVACGDAVHLLADIADGIDGDRPDVIVIDPPKFATRSAKVEDALRKYTHLNTTAMRALGDGGWLISCSCSGRVDTKTFLRMLAHAARRAGCIASVVELRGAGPDHPTAPAHDEARYLKVAICRVRKL